MFEIVGVEAVSTVLVQDPGLQELQQTETLDSPQKSFSEFLTEGLHSVDAKVDHANAMVRQFAIDDTIPIHQVTMALEEARMAVDLALQVRNRLVDGYREIMNMQL